MRENRVDSPYLFLHWSLVLSVARDILEKMLKKVWSHPVDFCIWFRTIRDNPT